MKFFLVALAIACAAAEPEADSDSFYPFTGYTGYSGLYGVRSSLGYSPYTTGFTGYSGIYSPYTNYGTYGHVLGKREAEADSDAFYPYTSGVYGYNAYTPYTAGYTAGYTPYTSLTGYSRYYTPSVYSNLRVLGKREAESDSDSYYPYTTGFTGYSGLYNRNVYGYNAYTPYTTGYTGYTGFPYTTYNAGLRVLGKREAEADPELVYRNPVTDFHTNLRNLHKGVNVPQAYQGTPHGQVYNSVKVPTPVYTGYTGYTTPYAGYTGFPYTTYSGLRYY